ncbi:hypothetical protein ACA910_015873 [Epithemia clementina (nom. ined.)]
MKQHEALSTVSGPSYTDTEDGTSEGRTRTDQNPSNPSSQEVAKCVGDQAPRVESIVLNDSSDVVDTCAGGANGVNDEKEKALLATDMKNGIPENATSCQSTIPDVCSQSNKEVNQQTNVNNVRDDHSSFIPKAHETSSSTASVPKSAPSSPSEKIPVPAGQQKAPKGALYTWYFQKHRVSLSQEDYVTFDDGGRDHEKRFSSVFLSPMTGECFPSGRFGSGFRVGVAAAAAADEPASTSSSAKPISIIWYVSKKAAENGAAARAYDCLTFREGLRTSQAYEQMGSDEPSEHALQLPSNRPSKVRKAILEKLEKKGILLMTTTVELRQVHDEFFDDENYHVTF